MGARHHGLNSPHPDLVLGTSPAPSVHPPRRPAAGFFFGIHGTSFWSDRDCWRQAAMEGAGSKPILVIHVARHPGPVLDLGTPT
jgi:hypothetical protein